MTPERKVLLSDGGVGAMFLLLGLRWLGSAVGWAVLSFCALTLVVTATQRYVSDRGVYASHPGLTAEAVTAISLLLLAAGGLLLFGPSETFVGTVSTGFGLGVLLNRIAFGLVRPIPDYRLARVPERAV